MFAAADVVAQSDMVSTMMKRVAMNSPRWRKLEHFPPPIALPAIAYDLMWHRRTDTHPSQQWLREQIASLAKTL